MTEKQQIEKSTAEKFIKLYNAKVGTSFEVKELSDHPDVICEDSIGNQLKLEITLTEDRDGDIQALLGRSEHKSLEHAKQHGMGPASALSGNVTEHAYHRILAKMYKDYGTNVALVVRDVSPLGWDWDIEKSKLAQKLENVSSPFDKGIWILTLPPNQNMIFRISLK